MSTETQELMYFKNDLFRFMKKNYILTQDYKHAVMTTHYALRTMSDVAVRVMPEHLEAMFSEESLQNEEHYYKRSWMVSYYRDKGLGILKIAKLLKMSPNTVTKLIDDRPVPQIFLSDDDRRLLPFINKWKLRDLELKHHHFTLL